MMPKFAANLTMLFQEHAFLDRFEAAANAGFESIEYLFPYDYEPSDLKNRLDQFDLKQVLFNLPPGNWQAGERGIGCLPDRIDEFKSGVESAIQYAKALGVPRINCLAGIKPSDVSEAQALDTFVSNLNYAAPRLADANIELVIEPINSKIDMPGFFLDTLDVYQRVKEQVDHPNLYLQFDLYHMHIMHGDLIEHINKMWTDIRHIQFADSNGRHEPGTGSIRFREVFDYLDRLGYTGFASAEYLPKNDTVGSLAWLRTFN